MEESDPLLPPHHPDIGDAQQLLGSWIPQGSRGSRPPFKISQKPHDSWSTKLPEPEKQGKCQRRKKMKDTPKAEIGGIACVLKSCPTLQPHGL